MTSPLRMPQMPGAPGLGRPGASPPPPLLDLLGAAWALDAPVTGVAWDGALAGFALGDGSIAMARAEWDGAPKLGPREGGGLELAQATGPRPPVARQRVHDGACLSLAADPAGGFLSGGDDGKLAHVGRVGDVDVVENYAGRWVDLVASSPAGLRAWAVGRHACVSGPAGLSAEIELPGAATAMAFDPSGRRLALAHYRGVTLWEDGATRVLATRGCPRSVAWSPDGAYVVCGLQENALHGWRLSDDGDIEMGGYPGQPRSIAFAADGRFLASSGAPRVVCWRFDPPAGGQPDECGMPATKMPVCMVACHPTHALIAAGYHNGAVLLCQPGHDDVLFAKGSTGGSVTALAWSPDGGRLAIGTDGGEAGLVALPAALFRFGASPAAGVN